MILAKDCLLIHDAYAKAEHHALVLPTDPTLHDLHSLSREQLPLLRSMKVSSHLLNLQSQVGREVIGMHTAWLCFWRVCSALPCV